MNKFVDLYDFIDLAKNNRKYPSNTANGLKSSLKIFEKELNIDELNSINLIEDNMDEIFINIVSKNKDKNIGSLNTYKARLLKIIHDYQRYGIDPAKMQNWNTKSHTNIIHKPHKKDIPDKTQDKLEIALSDTTNSPVDNIHKIELFLRPNKKSLILIPRDITEKEVKTIKTILDSLTQ
jgi:hypothetical protein